jgi:flagellar hook-length control protein FliK
VSIETQGDQATVHFQAAHTAVREALDVAVPRLREMMAESGVNLAGVDVTQHGPPGQGGGAAHDPAHFVAWSAPSDSAVPGKHELQAPSSVTALGLIDLYA